MRIIQTLLALAALCGVVQSQYAARVVFSPLKNSSISNIANVTFQGYADIVQQSINNTVVTLNVRGLLANRSYGVHVHTWGDFSPLASSIGQTTFPLFPTISTVAGHFDTRNRNTAFHNCAPNADRHTGDIGNLTIPDTYVYSNETWFTVSLSSELLDLGWDDIPNNSIIGRTLVIHETVDNCVQNGNILGSWVAAGVIGVSYLGADAVNLAKQDTTLSPYTQANVLVKNLTTGGVVGNIRFFTNGANNIQLDGSVSGFAPNSVHGLHIHEFGDITNGTTFGNHYGDTTTLHKLPPANDRHWGDLGNVTADANGVITFTPTVTSNFNTELLSIWLSNTSTQATGASAAKKNNIIGRGLVFHAFTDQGPASAIPNSPENYGGRVAGGVIGIATPAPALAHAVISPYFTSSRANPNTKVEGNVTFTQAFSGGNVSIRVTVRGLVPGQSYGFHVHSWGDLSGLVDWRNETGAIPTTSKTGIFHNTVGGHFDAQGRGPSSHACVDSPLRHTGDVGNIAVDAGRDITLYYSYDFSSDLIDLGRDGNPLNSVIGRAVIIHENTDGCVQLPPADLGGWVGVGVIGIDSQPDDKPINSASQDATLTATTANVLIVNWREQHIAGNVWFFVDSGVLKMSGYLHGFAPNTKHGIHVHQSGNLNSNLTIGNHFAALETYSSKTHGIPATPNAATRHWGDLGNVQANSHGEIIFDGVSTGLELISLTDPLTSIIGRALAIHESEDDGTSSSFGPRYNYGVIGLSDSRIPRARFPNSDPIPVRARATLHIFHSSDATKSIAAGSYLGTVLFTQLPDNGGVEVDFSDVVGFKADTPYGVHIHNWGDLSGALVYNSTTNQYSFNPANLGTLTTTNTIGGHFDVFGRNNTAHGCSNATATAANVTFTAAYPNTTRHTGDIGNIRFPVTGNPVRRLLLISSPSVKLTSELLDLGVNNTFTTDSIIGRSIVIHELEDRCYQEGSSLGGWAAVGVIGIANPTAATAVPYGFNNAQQDTLAPDTRATATIFKGPSNVVGSILFVTSPAAPPNAVGGPGAYPPTIVAVGNVTGFNAGITVGVHIHVYGEESTGAASGPHFSKWSHYSNPDFEHSLPPSQTRHWGDLGNFTADANGVIVFNGPIPSDLISIWNPAKNGIIGRTLMFHTATDNGTDTSSYGSRQAWGVIGIAGSNITLNPVPVFPPFTTVAPTTATPITPTPTTNPSGNPSTTPTPSGNPSSTPAPTPSTTPTSAPNGTSTTSPPTTGPAPAGTANTISATIAIATACCAAATAFVL